MIKYMVLLILLASLMISCSKESNLTIYNDTPIMQKASVNGYVYELTANGEPAVETFYLNSFLITGETADVIVEYIPNSPVSYRSYKKIKLQMKPGKDKTLHINYDRGQIQLRNISMVTLDQVLLREIDKDPWTDDLYEGVLEPDEIDIIAYKAGNYAIKIVDATGTEYPEEEIEIICGEQLLYFFTGDMK